MSKLTSDYHLDHPHPSLRTDQIRPMPLTFPAVPFSSIQIADAHFSSCLLPSLLLSPFPYNPSRLLIMQANIFRFAIKLLEEPKLCLVNLCINREIIIMYTPLQQVRKLINVMVSECLRIATLVTYTRPGWLRLSWFETRKLQSWSVKPFAAAESCLRAQNPAANL